MEFRTAILAQDLYIKFLFPRFGRKPEADPLSSRNMQDYFEATTGFTWSYSGFFHSAL